MATTPLKTAIATYPHTQALKTGDVSAGELAFEHIEVSPITRAFRRMCRALEFDVAEMAITTYLTAKAYNKPFTAIPVFIMRQFHHAPIVYNVHAGVRSPKDLEGKRVGVRAYTVTTGVWARGILATEYGVDLSKVTWVLSDEEHVDDYHPHYPANVVSQVGANLSEMVAKGELDAAIGVGPRRFAGRAAAHRQRRGGGGELVCQNGYLPHQPYRGGERRPLAGRSHPGAAAVRRL